MVHKKIGLFGLDNAGKTTIVEVIEDQKDLSFLADLKPTTRVQIREALSDAPDWVIWDFGGQAVYRQEYLAKPDRYFNDLALMIFVIDVQDSSRFDSALNYLSECLNQLKKASPKQNVLILLHKVDPDIRNLPKIESNLAILSTQLGKILKKHKLSANIFTSTIFDAKIQLKSEELGKLDQESSLTSFIKEAKKLHSSLQNKSITRDQGGVSAEQKTQSSETLKALSLERKKIIEEFRTLLRK